MKAFYIKNIVPMLNIYTICVGFASIIAILLLVGHFLSGTEFVSFFVAICMFLIITKMLPYISEFSIAGNSLKLREKLTEADKLTSDLLKLRVATKRYLLKLILREPGGHFNMYEEPRMDDFLSFYSMAKSDGDLEYLRDDLLTCALEYKKQLMVFFKDCCPNAPDDLEIISAHNIKSHPGSEKKVKEYAELIIKLDSVIDELKLTQPT